MFNICYVTILFFGIASLSFKRLCEISLRLDFVQRILASKKVKWFHWNLLLEVFTHEKVDIFVQD